MKTIPIVGLEFSKEEKEALTRILDSKRITRDGWTERFHEEFARFIGVPYCTTVCSG
ncbi:MAG: DegT/DnrJ/EryC1/StrS aminotransferase family protein, partial [Aquificae bacterium]|nr:DegT/DnrJ/EryC1/StrS aminotransferase family protein [Aquificota bacterium]